MKKSSIFALLAIAISIAIIISTYGNAGTYGSFKDARNTNNELHLVGHLDKQKPVFYDPTKDANYFSFFMKDNNGEECKVVFAGAKPQEFERLQKIVLVGEMQGHEFRASTILMTCPSKYTNNKVEITEFKAKQTSI